MTKTSDRFRNDRKIIINQTNGEVHVNISTIYCVNIFARKSMEPCTLDIDVVIAAARCAIEKFFEIHFFYCIIRFDFKFICNLFRSHVNIWQKRTNFIIQ